MHLQVGTFLQGGKYKIEKVLGQGGFGITYLAIQDLLDRKVCIKEFFYKEYCERDEATSHVSLGTQSNREIVERFMVKFIKEARTISLHEHPNIIRIHDIFKENNTAYYVMEYIEGESLNDMVNHKGALSESEALDYIKQVASALDFIHQQSINHLDVKPANIMVRRSDNKAILIDFGLSKQYDIQGSQTSTTPVGISHGYAPMEQYKQGGVSTFSPQTDVYSLGATLYKLVTGNTPPQAMDILDEGLPDMSDSISKNVQDAIIKAMETLRKKRPQSIQEFSKLLNASVAPLKENGGKVDTPSIIITSYLNEQEVVGANKDESTLLVDSITEDKSIEAIDLGLSVKWANCNLGALKPTDCGNYYAWGEIEMKSNYNSDNYALNEKNIKKNNVSFQDVVKKELGNSWRIPTMEEIEELINKCQWEWEVRNGNKGYRIIGPNGNSIFLPICGYRFVSSLYDKGIKGEYWSSTPFTSNDQYAYALRFTEYNKMIGWCNRAYGRNIRAVYNPNI